MGGKTKQTQRTKNNSRPSNSGRSAELLGTSVPSFVGFASTLSDGGFLSVLPGFQASEVTPEEIDSNVDYNYQLVFRKMTKKDPTTKVKALQEFTELVGQSDVDAVKAILPFWPRLYGTLAVDVEHRVREFSQQAQAAVVNKCGKHIAPHLKQLAPIWITSQYDSYAPAGSVASTSFKNAFPPAKLQEVFNFCQNEVLEYIVKNLTFFTATTLSNPKVFSVEECESKYQRVVACSLQGYALYLTKMSADQLKEASEKNALLVNNPKFWNFYKHKVAAIRAAWFEALSALLQYGLFLLDDHHPQATSCVLQSIDESEPASLPFVWESVLLITQKIDDWNKHINMEKALLPKLTKVLKTGGNGNASVIFPHMLPFLAKLNTNVLNDRIHTFYKEFFRNAKTGLMSRVTRSDMSSISIAYYECLQFVFTQLKIDETFPTETELISYCIELVDENIVDVLEWCLTKDNSYGKYVFPPLASLLGAWSNKESSMYKSVLSNIWNRLYAILETSLDGDVDYERCLDSQYDLVQSFRNSSSVKSKNARVKFVTDEDQVDSVVKASNKLPDFDELIYRLCTLYIKKTTASNSPRCLANLENFLKQFGSADLFMKLSGGKGYFKLYDTFSMWLFLSNLRKECVVDIILLMYNYMNADEKMDLLNKLIKFNNEQVQTWFLARLLSHPLVMEPNVTKLIGQTSVTKILLKCANAILDGDTKENINFLHKCFFQNENGEILIDNATCDGIVRVLAKALNDESKSDVLDTCTSFLAQIMPVICCDPAKKDLQNFLFIEFFAFSIRKSVCDDLSEDTMWEITTSWQDALSSNDLQLNQILLNECSSIIDSRFNQSDEPSVKVIEHLAEVVSKLILCSIERIDVDDDKYKRADEIIDTIFNQRVKEDKINFALIEGFCGFLESVNQMLTVPSIGNDKEVQCVNYITTINQFFKWWYFKFNVVFKITCRIKQCRDIEAGESSGDDEYTEDFCDLDENLIQIWSENIFDEILHGIYVATLANTLINHSIVLQEYTETLILNISESVVLYLKNISSKNLQAIKEKLIFNAGTKGLFWSLSCLVLTNTEQYGDVDNGHILLYEDVTSTKESWDLAQVNMYQVIASKMVSRLLPIPSTLNENQLFKSIQLRCIIKNYFHGTTFSETDDRKFIETSLKFIGDLYTKSKTDKEYLLYNEDISQKDSSQIILVTEIVNLLAQAIAAFPTQLDTASWDLVRIALSSWVLTVSKTSDHFKSTKVAIFITSIYRLFGNLSKFIAQEKTKSSTEMLTSVLDEWEHLFAKDVNLILLKCYMKFINYKENDLKDILFIESLSSTIATIDFKHVIVANKIDSKTSMEDLINFALGNISHSSHTIGSSCADIIKRLAKGLISQDVDQMNKRNELEMQGKKDKLTGPWHLLHKFEKFIQQLNDAMKPYTDEFTFKATELDQLNDIPTAISIPYLLLWDCILDICSKSSSELRSTYASYISDSKFDQSMLNNVFRLMPDEILRNQDSKQIGLAYFSPLTWEQICDVDITPERYTCFIYTQTLRHLPAVVRKWWHDSNPRQKTLVDKITTCFVSPLICQEELRSLVEKREKHENMQITVHLSTREVLATYSIDEARMECAVTLPVNHPLGVVKVDSGKQIGSRLQSRVLVMQLTIFLTHQNGSVWDALVLWKRNLDRKFEGVEECYVCYSVIHQDTCQLPKLSCKTCKKKFHGTCLYKWFSTSSKSTCPICRKFFNKIIFVIFLSCFASGYRRIFIFFMRAFFLFRIISAKIG